jgi:DMSO/TMAO reductase YedYZ molybdopterin-dependent catalytic subunit
MRDRRSHAADLAATAAGLGTAELTFRVASGRSFLDGASRYAIDKTPLPIVENSVHLLRGREKPLLRELVPLLLLAAGAAPARLPGPIAGPWIPAAVGAVGVGAIRVRPRRVAAAILASGLGSTVSVIARRRAASSRRAPIPWTLIGLGALGTARLAGRRRRRRHLRQVSELELPLGNRRPTAVDGAERWRHPTPLLTPVDEFFRVDVNFEPPLIDGERWRLAIRGEAGEEASLGWRDLAPRAVEFDSALICIHDDTDGRRAANARWAGVPIAGLAELVRPGPDVTALETRAVDGYTIAIPADLAMNHGFVVIGMNGRALPTDHGFPARVLVPGLHGQYAGAKWLVELAFRCEHRPDYWGARGWPADPPSIAPQARIDAPASREATGRSFEAMGVAWAPASGVAAVEVAVDDGPWQAAELAGELDPRAWRRWRFAVNELTPGTHRLSARATARDGTVQESAPRPYFPRGVRGLHAITVAVR